MMAKGLEDTAFYRYNRFIALNEVGGEPQRIGGGLDAFHKANAERARRWPHALSATATHDTKRGEDARARLAVLTELPAEWAEQVREWRRLLRGSESHDAPPDANDEYYFYQSLLGAWPPELCDAAELDEGSARGVRGADARGADESRPRGEAAYELGRRRTSATRRRCGRSSKAALDAAASEFLARFTPFASRVARSRRAQQLGAGRPQDHGTRRSRRLSRHGAWDFSLVDPGQPPARRFRAPRRSCSRPSTSSSPATQSALSLASGGGTGRTAAIKLATTRSLLAAARARGRRCSRRVTTCRAR